jgi:hypothetical protein
LRNPAIGWPRRSASGLRRALAYIAAHRDEIWLTTPGEIAAHFRALA